MKRYLIIHDKYLEFLRALILLLGLIMLSSFKFNAAPREVTSVNSIPLQATSLAYGTTGSSTYVITLNCSGGSSNSRNVTVMNLPINSTYSFSSGTFSITAGGVLTINGNSGTINLIITSNGSCASIPPASTSNFILTVDSPTSPSNSGTFKVDSKVLSISSPSVVTRSWDGTTNASITGVLSGVVCSDDVSFDGAGSFSFTGPGVGIPVVAAITLSGTEAGNYSIIQPLGLSGTILIGLGVELSNFQVSCMDDQTKLISWSTLNEYNSSYFDLERSKDGYNWTKLTTVEAAGNSTSVIHYEFSDESLYPAKYYYKLIQHDFDEKHKEYGVISANCTTKSEVRSVKSFPNPGSGNLHLEISNIASEDMVNIEISDSKGRVMYSRFCHLLKGINVYDFSDLEIQSGIYYISIQSDVESTVFNKYIRE